MVTTSPSVYERYAFSSPCRALLELTRRRPGIRMPQACTELGIPRSRVSGYAITLQGRNLIKQMPSSGDWYEVELWPL